MKVKNPGWMNKALNSWDEQDIADAAKGFKQWAKAVTSSPLAQQVALQFALWEAGEISREELQERIDELAEYPEAIEMQMLANVLEFLNEAVNKDGELSRLFPVQMLTFFYVLGTFMGQRGIVQLCPN